MDSGSTPSEFFTTANGDGDLAEGTVVAERYRVEGIIGAGGAGTVYRAEQLGLGRKVALKLLKSALVRSEREVERFSREAFATAQIRHPNIVTAYDFGRLPDGGAYLAMEYLTGPALEEWLDDYAPISLADTYRIVAPVCDAVGAAHAIGIVHRDIKPANIIFDGGTGLAWKSIKIVDFGIARLLDSSASLTGASLIGTPSFLAPEVIEGDAADARSDVYALTLVAYELLTGRPAFSAATAQAVLLQHLNKEADAPSTLVAGLSREVDAVIAGGLVKDPARRYQTPAELAGALERVATRGQSPGAEDDDSRETVATEAVEVAEPSILVVEDDAAIRTLLALNLKRFGYDVTVVSDGIDALMRLGAKTYDLILSDVDMPNLDGFSLIRLKSEKGITTPIIFLSARGEDYEVRGLELGAEDYIQKPIQLNTLRARVKRVLERSSR